MKFLKLFPLLILTLFLTNCAYAQQTIKDLTVNDFKVENVKQGSKPCPLMTETQRNAIATPQNGRCIYNTTAGKLNIYDGSTWKAAGGGVDSWVTSFAYTAGDLVIQSNKIYKALLNHTSGVFATDLANGDWIEVSQGVTDHTALTNIGTNTHPQIDSHIANNANPHAVTKAQVGLSAVLNIDTTTTSNISDFLNKRFVLDSDLVLISTISGKQDRSTLSLKGDIYGATASATTTRVPVGPDGQFLTAESANSSGLGYRQVKEDESVAISFSGFDDTSTWSKGNNANVMGGGSFAATLVRDTSTKIAINGSFKMTQAAGSLNDYFCTSPRTIYKNDKGDTYFTARSTYDGATGDIQPYLWDATNSVPLNLVSIKGLGASNSSIQSVYAVNIPDSTNSVQLCYQVKALNSGKIFNVSQIQLTKNLSSLGIVNNTNNYSRRPYTPTITGFGTPTNINCYESRDAEMNEIDCTFTSGVATAVEARVSLPNSNISVGTLPLLSIVGSAGVEGNGAAFFGQHALIEPSTGYLTFGNQTNATNVFAKASASSMAATGQRFGFKVRVPIAGWDVGNAQVASSNQITSSDSMVFVHKATAIVSTDPVGTYNTYTYAANTNTATIAATAPTQSLASMNSNGFQVFARAYNAASTAASPSRVDIFIGRGLNGRQVDAYSSLAKTGVVSYDKTPPSSYFEAGVYVTYSATSGILSLDAGFKQSTGTTAGFIDGKNTTSNAYFTFTASTQPSISVIPNASLCNKSECIDEFVATAVVSGGTIVSVKTNYSGWATITQPSTGRYLFTFSTGRFTETPACTPSSDATTVNTTIGSVTNLSAELTLRSDAGAYLNSASVITLKCSKTEKDSKPTQFKVAGINDISVSYWLPANFAASTTIPINFSSEEWDNCTPKCVTVSPTAWRFTAPKAGVYTILGKAESSTALYYNSYKNGAVYKTVGWHTSSAVSPLVGTVKLLAGEYIDIRLSGSATILGGAQNSQVAANISIQRTGEY